MTRAGRPPASLTPATRLTLLAAGTGLAVVTHSPGVLASGAAAALCVLLSAGPGEAARRLRLIAPMALLVLVVGWGFFDARTGGLLALRVLWLLTASAACFATVSPEETGAVLDALRVPRGPAFVLTAGLRYVPLIRTRLAAIRDAQQARGIDLRPRVRNVRHWMALLLPLLVQAVLLADDLALAMESRGYASRRRRPRPLPRPSAWDWTIRAAAVAAASLLLYAEFGG
jgi:energy-coupling factor transport system permease protein